MSEQSLTEFIKYCAKHIKGDEKGEAQTFLDRFFSALGYEDGYKGAGAECEFRIRNEQRKSTSFADLVWKPRVLIEMKKRGEDLGDHYQQAFSYWLQLVPNRPQYTILCNFDEFWIYDLNTKLYDPVDIIKLPELEKRKQAFAFLFPEPRKPVFASDREDVTEDAAKKIASIFITMCKRGIKKEHALQYCLQCIVAMFAEDTGLLPEKIFTRLIDECVAVADSDFKVDKVPQSYDLIAGLFTQMNSEGVTPAGKYKGVDYFNGGLFKNIYPIELHKREVTMLEFAAHKNWNHVNPAIFGNIFESFMGKDERHMLGAHYTHETDIMKVVDPVIVQPWKRKIEQADTLDELYQLIGELRNFKVLDPACGSGNFLFIAFKEMKLLERTLLNRIRALSTKPNDAKRLTRFLINEPFVSIKQFYGIDIKDDAIELAKVTLMVAKELWVTQNKDAHDREDALPLDNLDANIICADSLLTDDNKPRVWPEADAIIGNPPYQARSKMLNEFGREYLNKLWDAYPEMNKYADFCTYWFYKAHKHLKEGGYAGLVGTNSIRENNSRESSLDYIVDNGGVIYNAVSSEVWSGDAVVFVSIVNWKKGKYIGEKILFYPDEKMNLHSKPVDEINSSLSLNIDLTSAKYLDVNSPKPAFCIMGQKHGHEGFLLTRKEATTLIEKNKKNNDILKPYLIGRELVSNFNSQPERFVIDFSQMDLMKASSYKELFKIITEKVLPTRKVDAENEIKENEKLLKKDKNARISKSYQQYYSSWWQLIGKRPELVEHLKESKRYIAVSAVSKRNIFEFISSEIRPNASLISFMFDDYYSFGILQSTIHWEWWKAKCSTLKGDYRYTIDPVWDTFPWPQNPTEKQIEKVAKAAKALRDARNDAMKDYKYSLRDLYRILEQPGKNHIKDLHEALDKAVMDAYGFDESKDLLTQLLELNLKVHEKEKRGEKVQSPGLPEWVKDKERFVSGDCVKWEGEL
ncbi:MAG: DNA methyltransferase [Bacteroidia bacterium]